MRLALTFIVLIFLCPLGLKAQIFPKEGNALNYRIIGFSFPMPHQAKECQVEIASGYFDSEEKFKKNIFKRQKTTTGKVIAEVPAFGAEYTWCAVASGNRSTNRREFHHFTTSTAPGVDTSFTRCRVLKTAETYKDAYFFLDRPKALYNMAGEPVWFFPFGNRAGVTDLKMTPQGTITFLYNSSPLEINYNGDTLWKAPDGGVISGEKTENYSHEFTRLNNGNYMVLGTEHPLWELDAKDTILFDKRDQSIVSENGRFFQKVECGTLIEYNPQGQIVWSWKSSAYFSRGNMYKKRNAKGMFELVGGGNSFYFDEQRHCVYFSIRPQDRILKIQYPRGEVSRVLDGNPGAGGAGKENPLFCGQHSCKISQDGNLYLYNNNVCTPDGLPHVVVLSASDKEGVTPKKIWDYACTIEAGVSLSERDRIFRKGGNVIELPDSSFFIDICGSYSKVSIVSKDKQTLWAVLPEFRMDAKAEWQPMGSYRASIITSKGKLEQLIWHAQKK